MDKKEDRVYLHHIYDSIIRVLEYTSDLTYEQFLSNNLIQDGVIRQLMIMGEASKLISQQLKNDHTHVPWKDIAGMRDKLIHGYFGIDLDTVWAVV